MQFTSCVPFLQLVIISRCSLLTRGNGNEEGGAVVVTDAEIKRINELVKKSKELGLTDEEKAEQQALRRKYIGAVRASLKANLDSIQYVEDLEENKTKH